MYCFLIKRQERLQREYLEIERHGDVIEYLISKGWCSPFARGVICALTNSYQYYLQQPNTLQRRFVLRFPRSDDVITKSTALSSYLQVNIILILILKRRLQGITVLLLLFLVLSLV